MTSAPDQQAATEFAQGFSAFARAVDMVLKIGDVEAAHDAAQKSLAETQGRLQDALSALDQAKSGAQDVAANTAKAANDTIVDAKAQSDAILTDAKNRGDNILNTATLEGAKQKADLDRQIADARAHLEALKAEIAANISPKA